LVSLNLLIDLVVFLPFSASPAVSFYIRHMLERSHEYDDYGGAFINIQYQYEVVLL